MASKGKVFVGMSGGVDSSVAAALLQRDGYEVIGVFIQAWEIPGRPCTWRAERRDAMRVAARLGIPLLTLDLSSEYKREVVDYMIAEYAAGRTPNPDVMCNRQIKFGHFYQWARAAGADYVATGHYAQVRAGQLVRAVDPAKDQSYFLWTLSSLELAHTLFPIGRYPKSEVRRLAERFGLPTAEKKDSQGLCFLGQVDMEAFLKEFIPPAPGKIATEAGEVIGEHEGLYLFTLGQRHGFVTTETGPWYVVAKNFSTNTLVVSKTIETSRARRTKFPLSQTVWRQPPIGQLTCQIRYHGEIISCQMRGNNLVDLEEPQLVAPGQSVVVYDGEVCLGGGVVDY